MKRKLCRVLTGRNFKMKFKGKMASWWYVVTALINGISIGTLIYYGGYGPYRLYIPIFVVLDLYLIPVYFQNYVLLEKDIITVQFGLLKKQILVKDIMTIQTSHSMSSSFSASFDRLAIQPKNKTTIYISVIEKKEFINALLKINKKIKYFG